MDLQTYLDRNVFERLYNTPTTASSMQRLDGSPNQISSGPRFKAVPSPAFKCKPSAKPPMRVVGTPEESKIYSEESHNGSLSNDAFGSATLTISFEKTLPTADELHKIFDKLTRSRSIGAWLGEVDKRLYQAHPALQFQTEATEAYRNLRAERDALIYSEEFDFYALFVLSYHNLAGEFFFSDEDDKRISKTEFVKVAKKTGLFDLPGSTFAGLDPRDRGYVLFEEFCALCAKALLDRNLMHPLTMSGFPPDFEILRLFEDEGFDDNLKITMSRSETLFSDSAHRQRAMSVATSALGLSSDDDIPKSQCVDFYRVVSAFLLLTNHFEGLANISRDRLQERIQEIKVVEVRREALAYSQSHNDIIHLDDFLCSVASACKRRQINNCEGTLGASQVSDDRQEDSGANSASASRGLNSVPSTTPSSVDTLQGRVCSHETMCIQEVQCENLNKGCTHDSAAGHPSDSDGLGDIPTSNPTEYNVSASPLDSSDIHFDPGQLFDKIDTNRKGLVSFCQVERFVIDHKPSWNRRKSIQKAFRSTDTDHDGYINRLEFSYFARLIDAYTKVWDPNRRISRVEFEHVAWRLGIKNPESVFNDIDKEGKGFILFHEFKGRRLMK